MGKIRNQVNPHKAKPIVVPEYIIQQVLWGYMNFKELNKILKQLCPGTTFDARTWALLGAVGAYGIDGVKPTKRLVSAALNQAGIEKLDKRPLGAVYVELYRAGSSAAQLIMVHRDARPLYFEALPQLGVIWQEAGGAAK